MGKVALFGAAGAIGQSIAGALRNNRQEYRVVGRSEGALRQAFGSDPLVEIVTWNPDDPASVRAAAQGIDTIVYLVGVAYDHFELHPQLMRNTLDGAVAAGVQRILLIGTVYPYGLAQTNPVREDHPRDPHTFKGRMRKQQEDLLLEGDAAGKIHGAVVRLPDFYGPGVDKSFLHSIFAAAANGGRAQVIGPLDTRHEYVFVPDVGPVVAPLIANPAAYGHVWHLAGAGTITTREVVNRAFALTGHKPKMIVAGKTALRLMGIFNPLMREMVEMNYLQTNPLVLDDSALRELLGEIRKTSYEEGIRQCVEAAKRVSPTAH
jgi:nucleoside-diphosphate-sugar epimerase